MSENSGSPLLKALLEASANSPLSEASPDSLNELMRRAATIFNKRPLDLSDEDVADTVLYYRAQRGKFAQLAKEKDSEAPKRRSKKTTPDEVAAALKAAIANVEF